MMMKVNKEIKDLSDWNGVNANEKSKVTFNCDCSYDASFNSLYHCKSGCHNCNPGGIDYEAPGLLYSMEVWNGELFLVHKTGICNQGNLQDRKRGVQGSIRRFLPEMDISVIVKRVVRYQTAAEARVVEKGITDEIHDTRFEQYKGMVGAGAEFTTQCGILYGASKHRINDEDIIEIEE